MERQESECFTSGSTGYDSMKSADFYEGGSINIYGDIRKVKRNPIMELFRCGCSIVSLIAGVACHRVSTIAICSCAQSALSFLIAFFYLIYEDLVCMQIRLRSTLPSKVSPMLLKSI